MKINKDYRQQIGTHANRINRAMPERNRHIKASSASPARQNSLAFAKTMLVMATLANTINSASGATEHNPNRGKRKNSFPTVNPKFLLHNVIRCTAAFGKGNDVHAHLPEKAASAIPMLSSKVIGSEISLTTYQRQSGQPRQLTTAMINQAMHQRTVRQAPTTPAAATPASNIYIKHLMSTLRHTTAEKLKLSQAHDGISYNGYAFQGLQEKSLLEAKQQTLQFIQQHIAQSVTHLGVSTIERTAALLLKIADPLLARIQDGDPLANKIHYCDHQCGLLTAGIEFVEQIVGDEADHYSIQTLTDIGRDYLKQSTPAHTTPTAIVEQLNTHQALSIRDRILLKKASAEGAAIDLARPIETKQQLHTFLQNKKDHHALIKAQRQLAQPIPTRHVIAKKILKKKGLDPNQAIAYVDRNYAGRGGGEPTVSYIPLTEAYMSKTDRQPTNDADRALINGLPDNLDQKFHKRFDADMKQRAYALNTILKLQIQQLLGKENAEYADYILVQANLKYVNSRTIASGMFGRSSPIYASESSTAGFLLKIKTQDSTERYLVFSKEQGLQNLPAGMTPEKWIIDSQDKLFEPETLTRINAIHHRKTFGSPERITSSMTVLTSGNLADITTKAAEYFVDNNIKTLKKQAYEQTELQTENQFLKDFFRCQPFLQELFCDDTWAQRATHYAEDIALFFLPGLVEAELAGTEEGLIRRKAETLATKIQTSVKLPKPFLADAQKNKIAKKYPAIAQKLAQQNTVIANQKSLPLTQSERAASTGKQILNKEKWRLPANDIPSEFQNIEKGHTQSWTHPLTGKKLIVTRLIDQNRVVALKHKGGSYREVNWATGKPYRQRPLIFKQTDGKFYQAGLLGGMKEGDDLPGTSTGKEIKPGETREISQPEPDESKKRKLLSSSSSLSLAQRRKQSVATLSPALFEKQHPHTKVINGINTAVFPDTRQFPIYAATYFHGSGSASLLAFTDFMPAGSKGKLLPIGALKKLGIFPFCGERGYSLWTHSASNKRLSVTTLPTIDSSLDYAKGDGWLSPQAREKLHETQKSLQSFSTEKSNTNHNLFRQLQKQRDLLEGQLFQFQHLSEEQKRLVNEGFPVLYGIKENAGTQAEGINSDIRGEIGIPGGVEAQDIEVIYIPENKIPLVKTLLGNSHIAIDHIQVEKIEPLLSFSRARRSTFS